MVDFPVLGHICGSVIENDHIVLIDFGKAVKISEAKMYIWEKLRGKNT